MSESLFDGRLSGVVARVLFENKDSGWSVFHLEPEEGGRVTVVGAVAPVYPGENIELTGRWETDRRYGKQFRAVNVAPVQPAGEAGTRRYLASGAVPGIGPELARRLVARFGSATLQVLDEEPDRLLAVRGIGAKRLAEIKAAWVERTAARQARIFLQGHGLGPALAERILRSWGDATVARVKREPYELVADVRGVGFRTADALARRVGIAATAPERVRAGVLHVLRAASERGHCYVVQRRLARDVLRLLELDDRAAVAVAVADLEATRAVVVEPHGDGDGRRVYLRWLQRAEARVARRLARMSSAPMAAPEQRERVLGALRQVEHRVGLDLARAQRDAVVRALLQPLVVVTGGPGTGKTTLIDALVRSAAQLQLRVVLAAPTGRAAKRVEQATGRPASTLHRLLEYRYDTGFGRGPEDPISADLIVVDEVSMVDLALMDALVAAVPEHAHLVLVGDADQLPPVGPGAVLRDLLASDCVASVRLQEVYRQAQASLIVTNAHRVNAGQMPLADASASTAADIDDAERDFYIIERPDAESAVDLVLRLVTDRIPTRFGLDPMQQIQVLSPMHRGVAGVAALNAALQDALNPGPEPAAVDRPVLRPGDRVMQLRNDYDREVFNGDIGRVAAVDVGGALSVDFDGRLVGYDTRSLADLTLAYAISVHKSQGSEYGAVVALLLPEHRIMLQRNLLYTALTRARRIAVLVTTEQALRRAVGNASPAARYTALAERLAAAAGDGPG